MKEEGYSPANWVIEMIESGTKSFYNNDNGDLISVAKLSQPIVKDFTKEALIRVKLDY